MLSGDQANLPKHGSKFSVVFSKVDWQAERVAIVASGPSFFDPRTSAYVLSVKGTIDYLSRVDSWFTLDVNDRCAHVLRDQPLPDIRYVAAVPDSYGPSSNRFWHRQIYPNVTYLQRVTADGLSQDKGIIHSGNSGWGAFQLALHMGARRIVLIGMDATNEPYAWANVRARHRQTRYSRMQDLGPRSDLSHLPTLFADAVLPEGVRVVNASRTSRITCFPKLDKEEAIRWLEGE